MPRSHGRKTLDRRLQKAAERAAKRAGLRQAQIAIVAMRPDGRVVAMVGGKDYKASPFNRATQARRQPGSAFKLFVYLAAMRSGLTPDDMIEDEPITIAGWSPKNSDGKYEGKITLRRAFQKSSNVAAARLIQKVGDRRGDQGGARPRHFDAAAARGDDRAGHRDRIAARIDQRVRGGRGRRLSGRRARDRGERQQGLVRPAGRHAQRVRRQDPRRDARLAVRLRDERDRARSRAVGADLWQDRDDAGFARRAVRRVREGFGGRRVGWQRRQQPQCRPVGRRRAGAGMEGFHATALGIARRRPRRSSSRPTTSPMRPTAM